MTEISGCITVDISDWSDDLTICADPEDVVEIMRDNDICIHELLEHFDVPINVDMKSIINFIMNNAGPHQLEQIIEVAVRKMRSDYLGMAGRLKRLENDQ
jgi:hypothetical protein